MALLAVYDTNVIVSAILKPGSVPASLVAFAMSGAVKVFLSPELLAEYREVLNRPIFGFDPNAVAVFLHELEGTAGMVYPTERLKGALDEPDNRILECAHEAKAEYVVTGNKKHFPVPEFQGIKIVSPSEFATILVK